ncbi:mCG147197 [Mus musculus]|nr:mCG147197 [Mus musculus]
MYVNVWFSHQQRSEVLHSMAVTDGCDDIGAAN